GPDRIVRSDVDQHIRIDEDHRPSRSGSPQPRVILMSSSASMPGFNVPRSAANRLFRGSGSGFLTRTSPASFSENSTFEPGRRPRRSRKRLGIVTWPLLVILGMVIPRTSSVLHSIALCQFVGCTDASCPRLVPRHRRDRVCRRGGGAY